MGEQKPLGKTPSGATPVPRRPTYLLPTFYMVKSILRHSYRQGCVIPLWEGFGVEEATLESSSAFKEKLCSLRDA